MMGDKVDYKKFYDENRIALLQYQSLKVFKCEHSWTGGYGNYDRDSYIIVANNETEALGIALEQIPTSKKKDWEIEEIDISSIGAHWVSSDSN